MDTSFTRAIVTGSESGIGRATAVALARRGLDVGISWHIDEAGAYDTAREVGEHGRRVEVRRVDVARPDDAARVVGELADAREIAEAIVYLASPQASYTTGTSLVVDGGMLLMAAMANQLAGAD